MTSREIREELDKEVAESGGIGSSSVVVVVVVVIVEVVEAAVVVGDLGVGYTFH